MKQTSMRGMGGTYPRGVNGWRWIRFYNHGRYVREPVKPRTKSEAAALKYLKQRLADVQTNRYIANEEKIAFEDLAELIVADYKLNNRKSLHSGLNVHIKHLREYFGFDRALDIEARHDAYKLRRREEGASVASVNRESSTLRRMFSLAVEKRRLSRVPVFKMLAGERVREGFVSPGDFTRLLGLFAEYHQSVVEWGYYGGWRKTPIVNLQWKEIDMHSRTARLKAADSKNGEPWVLPLAGRLWEIVEERAKARRLDCVYVFHHDGQKIGDFRKAWQTACVAAGLGQFIEQEQAKQEGHKKKRQRKKYEGLLFHDLRRSAARNMSRAGVGEQIAMKVTGHKTTSMYRRYRIIDENEIREALERTQAHLSASRESKVANATA